MTKQALKTLLKDSKQPLLLQHVECGLFGVSEDFLEEYQSLDEKVIKNKSATYFLLAKGKSMEPTVFEDDILVVDRSIKSFDRKVCVIAYNGELLCKRVFVYPDKVILKSDNPQFKDIAVYDDMSTLFWGVVISRVGQVR
ncbi:S24 family peptidase [Bacteriovoracaceae bacterium]|nr:S24 family peptidase [Bacteriovoracaceae bacterium]|tara:strand:+ start:9083 stop:9502 length:420 start_codon:yes stop_codon:yes gene_type:complete